MSDETMDIGPVIDVGQDESRVPFFVLTPQEDINKKYVIDPFELRVVQDSGVEVDPDVNFKINTLNKGTKHIVNNSGNYPTFNVDVLIKQDDVAPHRFIYQPETMEDLNTTAGKDYVKTLMSSNFNITYLLDYYIKHATKLYLVTEAVDVANDVYIITGNKSRKQTYLGHTIWNLEFTKYSAINRSVFKYKNTYVKKAIAKYKKYLKKQKAKAKQGDALKRKLKACNYKKLVYSKKKKVVKCVKYMQEILYKAGHYKSGDKKTVVDGWYGKETVKAVKDFQKKHKKDYKLKVTGKVNKNTWIAMYGGKIKIADKTVKSNLPKAGKNNIVNVNVTKTNLAAANVKNTNQEISVSPILAPSMASDLVWTVNDE